jgi:hypothetical protein
MMATSTNLAPRVQSGRAAGRRPHRGANARNAGQEGGREQGRRETAQQRCKAVSTARLELKRLPAALHAEEFSEKLSNHQRPDQDPDECSPE